MNIDKIETEDLVILRLGGRIDLEGYPVLKRELDFFQSNPAKNVLLNLVKVELISSSGVGAFVHLSRELQKGGKRLVLSELSATCKQVLELLRIQDMLSIYDTEAEALSALKA